MKFKEFDEEIFKRDTNTTDLTNLEIVDETITTLQESYFNKIDGFRRIEKVSLLAIHLLQQENQLLKEQKEELTNMVCNKVLASYEYSSPLKDSLNEANLKIIALEESKHITELENKQLKEVIEEVRKTLKLERKTALSLNQAYTVSVIDSVLQILDKGESDE